MKHITQKDSNGCGAACLAMLLDISYEEARKNLPGYTSYENMKQVIPSPLPEGFTLLLVGDTKRQHWIVWYRGKCYDPAYDKPTKTKDKKYAGVLKVLGQR